MKAHTVLRAVGVIGIVASLYVYSVNGMDVTTLIATFTAIIALVSPEVLNELPWGPNKS